MSTMALVEKHDFLKGVPNIKNLTNFVFCQRIFTMRGFTRCVSIFLLRKNFWLIVS